ncbi:GGDEF domain-containing protein [Pelomicrobium methylotrophicum]|uniref:diguanylate cyclase n=1 Tax=Pelomicrobium methylotrophicum TaxID=2602750 RepID=A0A5C7ELB6_9PROT|nr:GGDEF domain-containing protein [Pelomicrobium methylotrophicum]TXF11896.1 GGDEF domain-containing protein [Pelomicrobium methylotrophicum]
MLDFLASGLVLAGICLLVVALAPVGRLIRQLPIGMLRRKWHVMAGLIVVFIVGYASYAVVFWGRHTDWAAMITPVVFFFGAGFVWMTATLSLQTAVDIRRAVLLEQEAITDPLTGLYNRRHLARRLEKEFARARRYGMPLSVLLLDIDHFKCVNDTYGHQVGDQVLNHVARLTLQAIRETDLAARYGGEEFVIIAPNTEASSAAALAERLRRHVETHPLVLHGGYSGRQEIRVTVSIGVAGLGRDTSDSQHLLQEADEALYRAKQQGRNRVVGVLARSGESPAKSS